MKKRWFIALLALCLACATPAYALCPYCNPYLGNGYTRDAMMDKARQLGPQAVGGTAHIVFAGNVRANASASDPIVGKVYIDESYEIVDIAMPENGSIWYGITYNDDTAWVSGGLVTVLPGSGSEGGQMAHLVGREVVVQVGSGSTRTEPGMAAEKAGIITMGEKFIILDCSFDQTNYLWYLVNAGGVECWVSSGIVALQ